MYMSYSKSFALATLALVSVHQSESFTCPFQAELDAVGKETLTVRGLFRDHVVKQVARDLINKNFSDSDLVSVGSVKLSTSELCEVVADAIVEALYAAHDNGDYVVAAKLVAYGAVLHKVLAEAWTALGLNAYFSDEA